ncbi:MAG: tRNA pseudouridine(55) synthase TruB [Bdellovibrionales bacterium]|nr:tRNA pseudouridine(55) synthase TruB [Bdellovibrionales bacterium]
MIHGVLLINKKAGSTSHDVVCSLRHIIGQKAVGHAGTLDPMAEGLILILLGYGTKLSNYLLTNDKRYHFVLRLGVTTDTLDKTGQIIEKKRVQLSITKVKQVLERSQGTLSLPVPLVSAVKIKGKKLYEYKRENKPVIPPVRDMTFYDLDIKEIQSETARVELSCSKGSYVRSWVSFIGDELGTGACLEGLVRLRSVPFNINSSLTVQQVADKWSHQENLNQGQILQMLEPAFIPFSKALPHIPSVSVKKEDEKRLKYGKISGNLKMALEDQQKEINKSENAETIRIMNYNNEQMVALLELRPFLSPKFIKVFPQGLY